MELWTEVRRRVLTGEISRRQACAQYASHWQTLQKILDHVEPPGYRPATGQINQPLGIGLAYIVRHAQTSMQE